MIGVAVARRIPVAGQRLDELQGQRHLALVPATARGRHLEGLGRAELVAEAQRRQRQRVADGLQRAEVLALAQHERAHAHALGLGQRVAQQRVRLGGGLALGRQVVRLAEVEEVDGAGGNEVTDGERLRRLRARPREVLLGQHDELTFLVLVALHDLGPRHLDALRLAHALVIDGTRVLGVEQPKVDLLRPLGGGVETHGNGDETEADCALPYRARHV